MATPQNLDAARRECIASQLRALASARRPCSAALVALPRPSRSADSRGIALERDRSSV
jgi:hypothetical protein